MQAVTTAVFPVAGLGTRFLPATKASPKEMLPIIDRPLIQYVVDEAVAAGITRLVFVTSYTKRAIEDYFDTNYELEDRLRKSNKQAAIDVVKQVLPENITCIYVRQPEPKGLGHAVLCAKEVVGNVPFVVMLADDVLDDGANPGASLKAMIDTHQRSSASVLAVEQVESAQTDQYGMVGLASSQSWEVSSIVEKPQPDQAPSNFGVIGRYVLSPRIFDLLQQQAPGVGGEIQLTDAISELLKIESVRAHLLTAARFDCGNRLGLFKAALHFAQKYPELSDFLKSYVAESRAIPSESI